MTRRPTALGAYIFAGGFTLGVQEHFDVLAHLEGDGGYGASCARANFPGLEVRYGPSDWRAQDFAGVDFVYTNPPCAIFSQAGQSQVHGLDWRLDPRVACWRECFALLEQLKPRAWVLESVSQAYTKGRELVDELTRAALVQGYSVTHILEDAAWFGLPQRRRRFLIVAHRPAHLAPHNLNWAPPPNVIDVLNEVTDPGPISPSPADHMLILPKVPPGGSLRATWEREGKPDLKGDGRGTGPAFLYYRLYEGAPRHALVGNRCYHPTEDRLLGENEMRAVCGFPPDFVLDGGNPHENGSLLARGLMPPVARWLSGVIERTLEQPDVTERDGLRVTLLDLFESPGQTHDLTAMYLNERGKVRMGIIKTVRADTAAEPEPLRYDAAGLERIQARAAAVPLAGFMRESGVTFVEHPRAEPGEGSGKFMQRLWLTTDMSPEQIVAAVHANWEGRTTKVSDCYFNYKKLIKAGVQGVRPWASGKNVSGSPAAKPASPAAQSKPAGAGVSPAPADQAKAPALDPGREGVGTPVHVLQPTRTGKPHKHENEFDTTSLTSKGYGYRVHRDYAAHFFRWGFTSRYIGGGDTVLEVGCGEDFPFVKTLIGAYGSHVPERYVGVDLNKLGNPPSRPWAEFHGNFNFIERGHELGQFSVIINLEVIEHMTRAHGDGLLAAMKNALEPDGKIFLSTPVFDGFAAANHVHEYTIPELQGAIEAAGLKVVRRFGTFANQSDLKKVATPEHLATLKALNEYYSTDVTACFLAPLYPDASRNNLWVLEHADEA